MNKVFEISKMRFKEKGRLSDINIIEAIFREYEHPHSNPWEIELQTKDTLFDGAFIELQYLITGEKEFIKVMCKISCNHAVYPGGPKEYIFN